MPTVAEALAIAFEHHQAGRLEAAEAIYRRILQADPEQADALHLLGLVAYRLGRYEQAVDCMGRAIAHRPQVAVMHSNLGAAYRAWGKLDEAVACCRRGAQVDPHNAQAHNNLGNALNDQLRLAEAAASFRRALELSPDFAEAHNNLGTVLARQGRLDEAGACYAQALRIRPRYAEALNNLGALWEERGKPDQAAACCRQALEVQPDFADAHNNLGNVLLGLGMPDDAASHYRRALEIRPAYAIAHSNALGCRHYRPGVTPQELAAAHAEWDRRHAAPLRALWRPHAQSRDPERTLRLGFVSADFGCHPVGYFLVRTLEALRSERCEVVCYADGRKDDALTARLRAASTRWHDVQGDSADALAERIRADAIDILFDLAGHSHGNRLLTFARKPAPIQITWIGYPGTTGLAAMDYLLADPRQIPPQAEGDYRERVLRMPEGYVCYDPPADAPPVGPLPALQEKGISPICRNGPEGAAHKLDLSPFPRVTFGSFNNPAKITPQVVAVWAELLRQTPASRLVLKFRGLDEPSAAGRLARLFAGQGIDPARLELRGESPHAELLGQYGRIDVALDTFPYSGGLTTCEALWMGVPVVTCPGATFASRHSLSHLTSVGLTETVAPDLGAYVEVARALAGDLSRLAAIRGRLRGQMAASPLCDGPRFAGHLMALLRGVWRQWVEQ
jgi:predicted O-linked N-acetylglucosamine transferase (SPINDLY family)